jgi:hypothetical protein
MWRDCLPNNLVREIAPGAHEVGLITNLKDPKAPPQAQELEAAAKILEVTIKTVDVNSPQAATARPKCHGA